MKQMEEENESGNDCLDPADHCRTAAFSFSKNGRFEVNILICGASGFIGRHLEHALSEAGHVVVRAVRHPHGNRDMAVDFRNDSSKERWLPRLEGIDVVINAVGVLRDSESNPMQQLHHDTPLALYAACAESDVKRVVHFSALGIADGIDTPYFTTRVAVEEALRAMPAGIRWLCLRPSVIYGEDGGSARMFRMLAGLPVQLLPMGGTQKMQPVHIDDICASVVRWIDDADAVSRQVDAVGAEPVTMRGMLDSYRSQLGHSGALHICMPESLVWLAAVVGDRIPASPLCSETLKMMASDNTAVAGPFAELLGRMPKSYREFIA